MHPFADTGEELDAARVTVNLALDDEVIFFRDGNVEGREEAKGKKNDSKGFCHFFSLVVCLCLCLCLLG